MLLKMSIDYNYSDTLFPQYSDAISRPLLACRPSLYLNITLLSSVIEFYILFSSNSNDLKRNWEVGWSYLHRAYNKCIQQVYTRVQNALTLCMLKKTFLTQFSIGLELLPQLPSYCLWEQCRPTSLCSVMAIQAH